MIAPQYKVLEKLGEGGMGRVFRAHQVELRRDVALKVLSPGPASDERMLVRFRREVKLLSGLSHPHIVPVFDGGHLAGQPYFTMELVEGEPLDQRLILDGPIPLVQACVLLGQVADALAYLHERGIHHRDIKPRNLILTRRGEQEHIVLVDFGLAQTLASISLTRTGEVVGTFAYLAPELFEDGDGGPARDVWALAVTAYEMVTGSMLFPVTDPVTLAARIHLFDVTELDRRLSFATRGFREILKRALSRDPAARPSAREMKAAFEKTRRTRSRVVPIQLSRATAIAVEPLSRIPPGRCAMEQFAIACLILILLVSFGILVHLAVLHASLAAGWGTTG